MRGYELVDEYNAKSRHIPNIARNNQGAKEFREALNTTVTASWPFGKSTTACKP